MKRHVKDKLRNAQNILLALRAEKRGPKDLPSPLRTDKGPPNKGTPGPFLPVERCNIKGPRGPYLGGGLSATTTTSLSAGRGDPGAALGANLVLFLQRLRAAGTKSGRLILF